MTLYKPYQAKPAPNADTNRKGPYDGYRPGMPLLHGHYIALEYLPERHLQSMLSQWRAWCKANPKEQWPYHVTDYAEKLLREGKRSELLEMHQ